MAEPVSQHTAEIPPPHEAAGGHGGDGAPFQVDTSMMVLTWITFFLVSAVLYKVAWKPILAALERRESMIRKAQEDAARLRDEVVRIDDKRRQAMTDAARQAEEQLAAARQAAAEIARKIEEQARDQAQTLVNNARREIDAATEKARATLRRDSAELAVGLASRVLRERLDEGRDRELVDRLIGEL